MAESLADRLKRIAAEKKAAREVAQAAGIASDDRLEPVSGVSEEASNERVIAEEIGAGEASPESSPDNQVTVLADTGTGGGVAESPATELPVSGQVSKAVSSDHPLAMKFAELEETLLARDPQFKVILRDIHRHLGQDAELVTQMSEEEIAMVVTGLVLFANTEIVEVAKAKTAKKAVAEAKKKVISADDL